MIRQLTTMLAAASLLLAACGKDGKAGPGAGGGHDHGAHGGAMHMVDMHAGKASPAKGEVVQVSAEGRKFDLAVTPAKIPPGAWYCEMGGHVHYARAVQGDGICPICHMRLKHKPASR